MKSKLTVAEAITGMANITLMRDQIDGIVSGIFGRVRARGLTPGTNASRSQPDANWKRWFDASVDGSVTFRGGSDRGPWWRLSQIDMRGKSAYLLLCFASEDDVSSGYGSIYSSTNGEEGQMEFEHVEFCWDALQILIDGITSRFPELEPDVNAIRRAAVKKLV